ncbi:esterase [filamentous cyanobacterium CCP5]|nr:esterase [filamentous cyanobacterium CCP5]
MTLPSSTFTKGDQQAVFHDEGDAAGYFHTYDALEVGASQPRKVHVFVPRDYETSTDSYPVIYMNDGDTAFFRGGAINESWYMGSVLSQLQAEGTLPPVIVVAIHTINRNWEYTHTNIGTTQGGGIETYARYVAYDLKGFIDAHYRTQPDPAKTLIIGASHGGLAAYLMGMLQPEAFGRIAAFSPSLWVGLDSSPWTLPFLRSLRGTKLMRLCEPTLSQPSLRPQIYMDWGLIRDGQFHNNFIEDRTTNRGRELRDLLVNTYGYALGQNLIVVEDPDGEHSEKSWHRRVPGMLTQVFGNMALAG